jgi:hypothetical protein
MPVDALPAAFSVPSQVETVGALAGLAAILGLAVLSMLYFAQARELKRLREWAGRAPERAAELQSQALTGVPRRVTPQPVPNRAAQRTPTPVPTPRPPGAPAPGAPGAAGATAAAAAAAAKPGATAAPGPAGAPAAAPGTGKPATAAASAAAAGAAPANGQTGTPGAPAAPASPDEAAKPGEEATAKPAEGEAKPAAALDDTMIGAPPSDEETGEQATTAQPAAKPAVPQPLPVPPTARTQGPRPAAPATPAARPATPRPRAAAPLRSASPSATIPPRGGGGRGAPPAGGDDGPSRGLRIGLVVGAIVLVLAAGIFAFTQLTGGDGNKTSGSRTTPAKTTTTEGNKIASSDGGNAKTTEEAAQPKSATTVAVLNGTTVQGLARGVADKLLAAGYKIGTVTNAPDQQRAATQVAYASGQQATARQVARTIDAGTDAIVPIDEVTQATAGSDAMIVVTVGADQSP